MSCHKDFLCTKQGLNFKLKFFGKHGSIHRSLTQATPILREKHDKESPEKNYATNLFDRLRTRVVIFLLLVTCTFNSYSQDLPKRQIEAMASYSFNGTGDIWGPGFSMRYTNYFKRNISWGAWLGCTIHDKVWPIDFIDSSTGRIIDISIRNMAAGLQGGGNIAYSVVRSQMHEFKLELGGVIRYQSTTTPHITTVLYPALTGIPFPVYVFQQNSPQRTLAIGANFQMSYNFSFNNRVSVGIIAGLQTDTNGERILPIGITVGKRF